MVVVLGIALLIVGFLTGWVTRYRITEDDRWLLAAELRTTAVALEALQRIHDRCEHVLAGDRP